MSVISLREKLQAVKLSSFKFVSFQREVTINDKGEKFQYLDFALAESIAKVTRSIPLYDPQSRTKVHESKVDVTVVRCALDVIAANEGDFVFPEIDGKIDPNNCLGSYDGDLFLDMSDSGIVWLTDVKFSKLSGDYKSDARKQRLAAAVAAK